MEGGGEKLEVLNFSETSSFSFFLAVFFDDHMHSLARSPFLLFSSTLFACRYVSTGRAESSTLRLFMSPRFSPEISAHLDA